MFTQLSSEHFLTEFSQKTVQKLFITTKNNK